MDSVILQGVDNSTGGIQISFPGGYNSTGEIFELNVSKVLLSIMHCRMCMEVHLKLRLQSLYRGPVIRHREDKENYLSPLESIKQIQREEENRNSSMVSIRVGHVTTFSGRFVKESDRLWKIVEVLSMQCCVKLLSDSFETY